jgi:hypothetical protein
MQGEEVPKMTLASLLGKTGARISRQLERPLETVNAVYDDELWSILESYGLLGRLDAGELRCHLTGVQLSRQNVGGLIGTASGPKLIADTHAAFRAAGAG